MYSKVLALSAILAVSFAGPVPEVHYENQAISSQSIVHHGPPAPKLVATKLVAATPIYHAAPTAVSFHASTPVAIPAHYSPAAAVSSQSIIRHDEPHNTKLIATAPVAPVAKIAVATPVHYAPVHYPVTKVISPAPIHYPITKVISPAPVVTKVISPAPIHYPITKVISPAPVVTKVISPAPIHYPITKVISPAPVVTKLIAPAPIHYPVTKVIAPAPKVLVTGHREHRIDAEYVHPKYEFSYTVSDGHSGDHKSQHEVRDGDVVHGEYSLLEADGSVRRVQYSADDHNGFNAVVSHSAPGHHDKHTPVVVAAH